MKNLNKIFGGILVSIMLFQPLSAFALEKEENVYATLNTDGSILKSVVNNHLSISDINDIEDQTLLNNILNLNGNEEYSLVDNSLTWKANGKDILYSGLIEKTMPISVKATYYLNEKEMEASKMIGKKGKIKIVLELENNSYNNEYGLYTPFVVIVGTKVDSENNSNVVITNGKVLNNGNTNFALAIASPGLYESLGLEELKDLDKITISFDTTKFSMSNIYFISTPKVLDNSDLTIFNKMDELTSSISKIQENMDKIEQGSNELKNTVLQNINDTSNVLNNEQLEVIKNQAVNSVKATFTDEYKNNIGSYAANQATSTAVAGALSSLKENDTYKYYVNLKSSIENNIDLKNAINNYNTYINAYGLNLPQISTVGELCTTSLVDNTNPLYNEAVAEACSNYSTISNIINLMETITEKTASSVAYNVAYSTAISVAQSSAETVAGTVSVNVASSVANEVKKESLEKVYMGIEQLDSGIKAFNNQGINKLTDYSNKISSYNYKLKQLNKLSNEYSGYGSTNATKTTFIYKMKSIFSC